MKREELRQWFVEWLDDYYDELYSEDDLTPEVAESVLTALRPVSREQVEKVWRGEWTPGDSICPICEKNKFDGLDADIWADWMPSFCPNCGAPMTDEAVQMVMERLGALNDAVSTTT